MPIPEPALRDLKEAHDLLEIAEGKLGSAAGTCERAGIPKEITRTIRNKKLHLGHTREHLAELPRQTNRAEIRRAEEQAEARQRAAAQQQRRG